MALTPLHICAAARLARGDLAEIDRQLTDRCDLDAQWLLLVKLALVSVANITDLEPVARHAYRKHPEVSVAFKKWAKNFEFAKYVRNILVGHTNPTLIAKAIEWKPELLFLLTRKDDKSNFLVNLFILETALNTYVDGDERHLVFAGDTDLIYPPDWQRFLVFLTGVVRGGMAFLDALLDALRGDLPPAPDGTNLMTRAAEAGATRFRRITKSRP